MSGINGAAFVDWHARERGIGVETGLFENFLETDRQGAIDNDPQCAVFVVITNIGECQLEVRVLHLRHGDQEVMRQVHRLVLLRLI